MPETFEDHLEALGFVLTGASRRGGRMWQLDFNRYLTFVLHDYHESVVVTWALDLGAFATDRGWVLGSGETSFHQVYPANDVRLEATAEAVDAELRRALSRLRIDFADPDL